MPPNPHDLIAYARGRIVIGEVLSVDDRSVVVFHGNEKASVPLADILATYPRPNVASLQATVNKLTAEAQAVHSALTAAGVTGPGTLAERVKDLANDRNTYCRWYDEKAQQMNFAHAALDKAPSVPRTGTLAERVKALAAKLDAKTREVDTYFRQSMTAHNTLNTATVETTGNLDERVEQLVSKHNADAAQTTLLHTILNTATYKTEGPLPQRVRMIVEDANDCRREYGEMVVKYNAMVDRGDVNARNNGKAHALLNEEPSVRQWADIHDRVADLLGKYRALKADYAAAQKEARSLDFVAKSHDHIDAVLGRAWHVRVLDERVAKLAEEYKALVAENKALREGWPAMALGTNKSAPPETTITVPAGANVRVVVEKP